MDIKSFGVTPRVFSALTSSPTVEPSTSTREAFFSSTVTSVLGTISVLALSGAKGGG